MSKYIRLKDGTIWDDENNYIIDEEGNYCEVRTFMGRSEEVIMIPKNNIEKESDNLEDLFDAVATYIKGEGYYVVFRKTFDNEKFATFEEVLKSEKEAISKLIYEDLINNKETIYSYFGLIWTDKGLIYVAKLNKDGEWGLI